MIDQLKTLLDQQKVEQVLKKKSSDKNSVRLLQNTLYRLGYGKELNWDKFQDDGDFGNSTANAVKAFASKHGIQTSGEVVTADLAEKMIRQFETVEDLKVLKQVVDNKLFSKLKKRSPEKSLVGSLQRLLNSAGFGEELNWKKFGADGDFGSSTANAVKAFASKEGIDTSGEEIDEIIAAKILEKFVPFLGEGWADVRAEKRHHRRKSRGQYFLLYPKGKRNFNGIERKRKNFEDEHFKDPKTKKTSLRSYRYEFEKGEHEISGEKLKMEYYEVKKFNKAGERILSFCYKEDHKDNNTKDRIVLHFTAGQTLGDIKTLSREHHHVSTAYILGRDGTIYRMFSPKQWAYHLGRGVVGGNGAHSSRGVGIEISNYGPLTEDGAGGLTFGSGTYFCSLEDTDAYIKLDKPFLGHTYYAGYTKQQYEGLIILLRYLTKTLNIERQFLPTDSVKEAAGDWRSSPRFSVFKSKQEADNFRGICSHVNYRESGKWDIGPAFDWEQVIAGVTAVEYKPSFITRTRGMLSTPPVRTESELLAATRGLDFGNQDTSVYGPDGPEVDI